MMVYNERKFFWDKKTQEFGTAVINYHYQSSTMIYNLFLQIHITKSSLIELFFS